MRRRTIVAKLQDKLQKELKQADLELVSGGIKTMTNHGGTGPVVWEEDGPPSN
jgi:hypothetical protein